MFFDHNRPTYSHSVFLSSYGTSLISVYGDSQQIEDTFWLYYMYLNPGEGFDKRYLIRRKIKVSYVESTLPIDLVPRIALEKYQTTNDTWATTINTDANYQSEETIGYLFTDEIPNSKPVYDCYNASWNDHMLVVDDPTCEGQTYLRQVGWISSVSFEPSIGVYRCFDNAVTNHFISSDPTCEGKTTEWLMGYLAIEPPLPQNQFIALSSYYEETQNDHWDTIASISQNYTFEQRIGYLFTNQHPNTIAVYDCYIDSSDDHMLVADDQSCDGAQNLGLMGWLSTKAFGNSTPIYQCFDEQATNHFISSDPTCNNKQMKEQIGYILLTPTIEIKTYLPITIK